MVMRWGDINFAISLAPHTECVLVYHQIKEIMKIYFDLRAELIDAEYSDWILQKTSQKLVKYGNKSRVPHLSKNECLRAKGTIKMALIPPQSMPAKENSNKP